MEMHMLLQNVVLYQTVASNWKI